MSTGKIMFFSAPFSENPKATGNTWKESAMIMSMEAARSMAVYELG